MFRCGCTEGREFACPDRVRQALRDDRPKFVRRAVEMSGNVASMFTGRGSVPTRAAVVCALAVLVSSCAVAHEPGDRTAEGYGTHVPALDHTKRPKESDKPYVRPTPNSSKNLTGTITVTVSATNGDPIPGAVVAYKGPERGTMKTDARGTASRNVKPGSYALDVQNCGDNVFITLPQAADLTVVAGTTTRGDIGGNPWEPRFAPNGQVAAFAAPPWSIGIPFTLKARVGDRCYNASPVQRAVTLDGWEYELTDPVQLFKLPSMRTDAKGWLTARFVCNGNGDGEVVLRDPRVGTRYVHILSAVPHPNDGTYCVT